MLSDPHERSWYDSHRESILRDAQASKSDDAEDLDLMSYFSASCYSDYDDGPTGFYNV